MCLFSKRVDHCSAEKVAELENITRGKNEELMSLKSQIEVIDTT